MNSVTAKDGTRIFYRDFDQGRPIVFSQGWPLNSDAWEGTMQFPANAGFRVVATDRRCRGRSDMPAAGNGMDTYATADNDDGVPVAVVDAVREARIGDHCKLFLDFADVFFGMDQEGAPKLKGWRYDFWHQGMAADINALYLCVEQFWASDFREELASIEVPVLVIHGWDDHVVPYAITSKRVAEILPNATLVPYGEAPQNFPKTHQDRLNADLLAFARSELKHVEED